jgi:hypothetical protein
MANNSGNKESKGMAHFLHKQWTATKSGKELHKLECERMKKLKVPARTGKGGKRVD